MNNAQPVFEKKVPNYSGNIYNYLPLNFPVYAVQVTHQEPVNGELLQKALDRTLKRMPYLSDTIVEENGKLYYAKNPLPMEVACFEGPRRVGGEETNYHLLDVTWSENKTWFAMYHGFTDGQGIYMFMESVLYHYYCLKDGVEYKAEGIRTDQTEMGPTEERDPYESPYELPADYVPPDLTPKFKGFHLPCISPVPGTEVRDHEIRIPSEELMNWVKGIGATPSIGISILLGEGIRKLWPDSQDPVVAIILMSIRKQLGCDGTFKNCTHGIYLPVQGTPMDQLPLANKVAALRGVMNAQRDVNLYKTIYNLLGATHRRRFEEATNYKEEIVKTNLFGTANLDSFFMDYIGSMHQTDYTSKITDFHFLCTPASNNTLHINIIEHNREFRIDCLACTDITPVAEAFEEAIRANGLSCTRKPESRFTLPLSAWHDSIMKRLG